MKVGIESFKLTEKLPYFEDRGLISQIRRCSNSISANIAQAFGREGIKDKQRIYIISRGSSFELQNHLIYGQKVKYFSAEQADSLIKEIDDIV